MTGNDIFELARTRQALPEDAWLSAQALYTTTRNIYRAFSQKLVTADQAKREKAQALSSYRSWELGEAIARNIPKNTHSQSYCGFMAFKFSGC